ncbi:MAG: 4-hydroxy-3-methylbut-2-enyl diphosphate reductase, partial [Dehalococcoidia bacterium]|nr:4-hydroxy-3-methylbut-2-enyl diphosphate reductase [Dehalococcoidia bacterium]
MTVAREVVLASPRGFCAGVDRAIEIVNIALSRYGPPVYVRREIVHNPHVVDDLKAKGAVFVESESQVPEGAVIIVTKVHMEAKRYVSSGYSILLIGHAGHDEIVGTLGEAPDAIELVESVASAAIVQVRDPARVVCLTQTTLSLDDTFEIVDTLRGRFPQLVVRNDICYATQNRQAAVKELARSVEAILVVGAANSSNTVRLLEVAKAQGIMAYRVSDAGEVQPRWLSGVRAIGVTSGASTP